MSSLHLQGHHYWCLDPHGEEICDASHREGDGLGWVLCFQKGTLNCLQLLDPQVQLKSLQLPNWEPGMVRRMVQQKLF